MSTAIDTTIKKSANRVALDSIRVAARWCAWARVAHGRTGIVVGKRRSISEARSMSAAQSAQRAAATLDACAAPEFASNKPLGLLGNVLGRIVAWSLAPLVLLLTVLFLPLILASSNEFPIWRQKRVGYRGLDIWVPKFSTMNVVASGELCETWFGRLIRPVGLDEILQVFLIAKGDMQWFGPRPFLRADLDELYINSVLSHTKPGFFSSRSLATGIGNRALQEGEISIAEMIRYDLADLENWSFSYASRLLRRTMLMVARASVKMVRPRS
jgi:lipopolysaccharide/colanic/teichoic acid biosynthesis glycosyltransferase